MKRTKKLKAINGPNRQIEAFAIFFDMEVLKGNQGKYQFLKKECATLRFKYEASVVEAVNVKVRLAKVMAEYDLLVKEYENLFGQMNH